MRAVVFHAPGEVRVVQRAEPKPGTADEAVVQVESTGVCGSDLHIYHGRVPVERGFTLGHELVGTVVAAGDAVRAVSVGDRGGATTLHLTEEDVRGAVKRLTDGRGADVTVDAVGHPDAFDLACRLTRKAGTVSVVGVYAERMEVHMAMVWVKSLTVRTGHANVLSHVDTVLDLMKEGKVDPRPLVTHHMKLDDAREAYAVYDRREALKIVMAP